MPGESTTLQMQLRASIKRYPINAQRLPEPDEEWTFQESNLDRAALRSFASNGVVESVDRRHDDNNQHVWSTTDGVPEWVDTHTEPPATPCENATGIRTITAGEEYTCSDPACDCRMDRETAEEVVA